MCAPGHVMDRGAVGRPMLSTRLSPAHVATLVRHPDAVRSALAANVPTLDDERGFGVEAMAGAEPFLVGERVSRRPIEAAAIRWSLPGGRRCADPPTGWLPVELWIAPRGLLARCLRQRTAHDASCVAFSLGRHLLGDRGPVENQRGEGLSDDGGENTI